MCRVISRWGASSVRVDGTPATVCSITARNGKPCSNAALPCTGTCHAHVSRDEVRAVDPARTPFLIAVCGMCAGAVALDDLVDTLVRGAVMEILTDCMVVPADAVVDELVCLALASSASSKTAARHLLLAAARLEPSEEASSTCCSALSTTKRRGSLVFEPCKKSVVHDGRCVYHQRPDCGVIEVAETPFVTCLCDEFGWGSVDPAVLATRGGESISWRAGGGARDACRCLETTEAGGRCTKSVVQYGMCKVHYEKSSEERATRARVKAYFESLSSFQHASAPYVFPCTFCVT